MKIQMDRLLLILLLPAITSCTALSRFRLDGDTRDQMFDAISANIPIGTQGEDAKKTMERGGFECELIESCSFSEDSGLEIIGASPRVYPSVKNARMIKCKRSERSGLMTADYWDVAIVLDKTNRVTQILVRLFMDGP